MNLGSNPFGMVVVDGEVLLDFLRASEKLLPPLEQLRGDQTVDRLVERFEIAKATLGGNVRPA